MTGDSWRYILSVDGRDIELTDGEVTLGRSRTATVRIEHESVSRSHALLTFDRGQAVVKDLNSSNGTFVAGRRIQNETALSDGDRIQLGAALVGFRIVPPDGPSDRTALIGPQDLPVVAAPSAREEPAVPKPVAPPMEISAEELLQVPQGVPVAPLGYAAAALDAVRVSAEPVRDMGSASSKPLPPPMSLPPPVPIAPPLQSGLPSIPSARRVPEATLSQVPLHGGYEASSGRDSPNSRTPQRERTPISGIPENVAPFLPRLGAFLVDAVVLLAINILLLSPIFLILFFRGELQTREAGPDMALVAVGVLCAVLIVAANIWYVVGGWAKSGRTPGKSLLGLAIISNSPGSGVGWGTASTRAIGFLLSAIPLGAGFLVILFRRDRRAWHDRMAGTWVVKTR